MHSSEGGSDIVVNRGGTYADSAEGMSDYSISASTTSPAKTIVGVAKDGHLSDSDMLSRFVAPSVSLTWEVSLSSDRCPSFATPTIVLAGLLVLAEME